LGIRSQARSIPRLLIILPWQVKWVQIQEYAVDLFFAPSASGLKEPFPITKIQSGMGKHGFTKKLKGRFGCFTDLF